VDLWCALRSGTALSAELRNQVVGFRLLGSALYNILQSRWVKLAVPSDMAVRVLDVASLRPSATAVLNGHRGRVFCTAFSPDGRHLATASAGGTARVWAAPDDVGGQGGTRSFAWSAVLTQPRIFALASCRRHSTPPTAPHTHPALSRVHHMYSVDSTSTPPVTT
jgi:WD40 repeat protein